MNSHPSRHRIAGNDAGDFWAAKDLLAGFGTDGLPKHARKGAPRFSGHIGRVGALAVSLGIGLAVANSATGVALAESDSDSSSTSSSSDSGAGATKRSVANSSSSGGSGRASDAHDSGGQDDAGDDDSAQVDVSDDEKDADSEDASEPDHEDPDVDESDSDEPDPDNAPAVGSDRSPERDSSQATDDVGESNEPDGKQQSAFKESPDVEEGPTEPTYSRVTFSEVATTNEAANTTVVVSSVTSPEEAEVGEVALFTTMVSTVLSPLLTPEVPVTPSIADALLALFRRVVTHTFFNKTPVVRSVTTEQVITGQVIIDIDAYDPNGDPLTYDIVQPADGFVFRDLITGKFVYTPLVPVVGDTTPVEFQVVVRDDSENLTGVLGTIQKVLHSIARVFGLAEAENYTQTVNFNVDPILQLPPSLLAVGGLPYVLGGDPVKLLSVAEIVDLDSSSLKSATVTIGLGRQDGDTLGYVAPLGSTIVATWVNDWTLQLTGSASLAQYEAALRAVTFSATDLGLLVRTVEVTLTDDKDVASLLPAMVAVGVLPGIVIDLPLLVVPVGAPIHIVGKTPVKLMSSVSIANADDGQLSGATVRIETLGRLGGDTLDYVAPSGNPITVVQTNAWTLTLSGVATVAQYEEALEAITFSASQVGLTRTVTITVTEADGDTNPIPGTIFANTIAPLPPTVVVLSLPPTHTIGKPGVVVAPVVEIGDLDSTTLTGATVKLGLGRQAGDTLSYSAPSGSPITASWNGTDTLTLSGIGTIAQYEAALEVVRFSATAGALIPRTVTINVVDDSGVSALVPAIVVAGVKNPDRPTIVVVGLAGLSFPNVGDTVKPITSATIVDFDSSVLNGATVTITGNRKSGDTLAYTPISGNPIRATYDAGTGELKLSGTATIAQYKQALEAVTFRATQFGGGALALFVTRTLQINITDDSNLNALIAGIVTVQVYR